VLDGTFLTVALRDRAYDLSNQHHAVPLLVQCSCPRQTAYTRILQRAAVGQSESEARMELYDLQARDIELPWSDEPILAVDTSQTNQQQMNTICAELRMRLFD
jgi:predicted kinase